MADWTDQKRRVATIEDCETRWGNHKPGERFRCYLCGHKFKPGDGWRWVYSGTGGHDTTGKRWAVTNLKTCDACDGPDVVDRWAQRHAEFYSDQFWAIR